MPVDHLVKNLFADDREQVPTRNGYGEGLVEAGKKNPKVVALCADLTESTRTEYFKKEFPEIFIEVGVAEQNLVTLASGMAAVGKIPFVSSYGVFSPGRNWEQIRTTIAYNNQPVKIAGAHCGVSVGPDGATHQMLEDMAIMRAMPKMTVLCPGDAIETRKATVAAAFYPGPVYLRFAREKTPVFTTEESPFEIGIAEVFWTAENPQVTIIACGPLVYEALKAANELMSEPDNQRVETQVINCPTIKPLDGETILASVKKTRAVVTVEEHQITGGLGGAVAEFLGENYPLPVRRVGMPDSFGESGEPKELLEKYGMTAEYIVKAVRGVLAMK